MSRNFKTWASFQLRSTIFLFFSPLKFQLQEDCRLPRVRKQPCSHAYPKGFKVLTGEVCAVPTFGNCDCAVWCIHITSWVYFGSLRSWTRVLEAISAFRRHIGLSKALRGLTRTFGCWTWGGSSFREALREGFGNFLPKGDLLQLL